MNYQNLVEQCQREIDKEFQSLTEDLNGDWAGMYGIDQGYCDHSGKCKCKNRDVPWRGFESSRLKEKCVPYSCEASCSQMLEVCHMMGTDPVIQGAMSKLTAYVVGPRGHMYSVKPKPGINLSGRKQVTEDKIKAGIAHTMETISAGQVKGWARVQRETFRRMLKGEYFRRWSVSGNEIKVRFSEPFDIAHPTSWEEVQNPPQVPEERQKERPSGKFGVHYSESDSCDIKGYFEKVGPNPNLEQNKVYYFWKVENMQHGKMLGDSNDERGVGLFYYSYMYIKMAHRIMDSLFRISQIQAKYAAIWTFAETARVGKIRQVAQAVSKDDDKPEEIAPGEHMGKGWEIELPSTKIRTNQWTAIIDQLLEFAGASADMPTWMLSSRSEGGRSNNVASEGPFDLSIQTHQDNLSQHDIELLWEGVRIYNGWSKGALAKARQDFSISYRPCTSATRDFHRVAASLIALKAAEIMSPQECADRAGADYAMTLRWLEEGGSGIVEDPNRQPSPEQPATGGPAPGGN